MPYPQNPMQSNGDPSSNSESKHMFRKVVRKMNKEGFAPKSTTQGFDQCRLGMEDVDQIRRNMVSKKNANV